MGLVVTLLFMSLVGSSAMDDCAATVYFVPLEIATYVPITRTTIDSKASEKWTVSSKPTKKRLAAILDHSGTRATFDEYRVRVLVLLDGNSYFVDANGVVHKDGRQDTRLDARELYKLRDSLGTRERHIFTK